ncbi:uncharacterized protein BDZ99DRAFT_456687 [Mytilinidion resinicola]|uniref:DUF7053 domain-containing protein n=1 Tax=Mytilinidion resinicola TaxID=574789 RepID=A0A6A6Z6Z9_9PEZI|nr:uncharacterized protein BDZ99DRAFT_456687 [Mytilinidion resinicola]KAF2816882.1 hypothetical protein BDZ99DRAFT_456687 [Mytilinidion resinicola]
MSRSSHTLHVAALIPANISPSDIIATLHNHTNCLTVQSLTCGHQEVPAHDDVQSDPYFAPTSSAPPAPLKSYEVTEVVTIVPGIGDWGKKTIKFFSHFQDTATGLRTRADASMGVVLHAEYRVQPGGADGEVDGEGEGIGYAEWVLAEEVTVECSWWLMPLVKGNVYKAHRDMVRKLVEQVIAEKNAQRIAMGTGAY